MTWYDGGLSIDKQRKAVDDMATKTWDFVAIQAFGMDTLVDPVSQMIGKGIPLLAALIINIYALRMAAYPPYAIRFEAKTFGRGVLFVVFGEPIVRAFSPDPAVVAYGTSALRIISPRSLFYAYRDGADTVLQRCRRHKNADADQP